MSGVLRSRRGIPRFARKLAAGQPVRIVAFGTSLTLHQLCGRFGGYYLDTLVGTLSELSGNPQIELVYNGMEGFGSWWAMHRVRSDLLHLPLKPDLVIVELAHNDVRMPKVIPPAMHAIVGQLQAGLPECEIVNVLFAPDETAVHGPNEAMVGHERVADFYGFPSFDLTTVVEGLIATGTATRFGNPAAALTRDGIHHAPLTVELIGKPFASAFVDLVRFSLTVDPLPAVKAPPTPFTRSDCASLIPFAGTGWSTAPPSDEVHCIRNAAAYRSEVLSAEGVGASVRFSLTGMHLFVWVLLGGGSLSCVIDGSENLHEIAAHPGFRWAPVVLGGDLADRAHAVEIVAQRTPLILGDLFYVGELNDARC